MKVLFCILGRTASGKDTLTSSICKHTGMTKLISYTTRAPRTEYEDTHIFASWEKFNEHYKEDKIAAYSKIGENMYWSTKEQLEKYDFYVNDYVGLKQIKALNLPNVKIVTIYVKAPEEERHKRAFLRDTNKEKYWQRNADEQEQFAELEKNKDWDYMIYNDKFSDAELCLAEIVAVERTSANVF